MGGGAAAAAGPVLLDGPAAWVLLLLLLAAAARCGHKEPSSPTPRPQGKAPPAGQRQPGPLLLQRHSLPGRGSGLGAARGFPRGRAGRGRDPPRFSPSSIRDSSCIIRSICATAGSFSSGRTSSAGGQGAGYTGTAQHGLAALAPSPGLPLPARLPGGRHGLSPRPPAGPGPPCMMSRSCRKSRFLPAR